MEWYAQYCGDWSEYHGSYTWQRLPGAGHRAIEDARAALDVIKEMAATWERSYQQPEEQQAAPSEQDEARALQLVTWLKEQAGA